MAFVCLSYFFSLWPNTYYLSLFILVEKINYFFHLLEVATPVESVHHVSNMKCVETEIIVFFVVKNAATPVFTGRFYILSNLLKKQPIKFNRLLLLWLCLEVIHYFLNVILCFFIWWDTIVFFYSSRSCIICRKGRFNIAVKLREHLADIFGSTHYVLFRI